MSAAAESPIDPPGESVSGGDPPPPWYRSDAVLNGLPGLLAGAQISGLVFFLNPQVPFSIAPLLRGSLLFGTILGLLSAAFLTPITMRKPGRAARLLPWTVTAVLAIAAVSDWVHASYLAYFIPPGINIRLIKTALWLSVGALVCFYTALLHTLQSRPYSRKTRAFLLLIALGSVVVLVERREAFDPPKASRPLPSVITAEPRPKLIVVGIDGATLDAILPLAEQGQLDLFSRLADEGAYARLASPSPLYRSALWTTVASGRLPYRHGVLANKVHSAGILSPGYDLRLLPVGLGLEPWRGLGLRPRSADVRSRQAAVAWEILARLGIRAGFIGWPATYGSPPEVEFSFSDRYFRGVFTPDSAQPPELAERGVLFQVSSDEIDPGLAQRFGDEVPHPVLRALGEDLWRQSLCTFLMEERPDVGAIFLLLPGLAEVERAYYGSFSGVQFEGRQDALDRQAAQWVTAYYELLDEFLADAWSRWSGPKIMAVVSAYGVSEPEGIRKLWGQIRRRPLRGNFRGAPEGVLFLLGEGVRRSHFLETVEALDVTPTLLYGLRLPIAQDLDGGVVSAAYEGTFLARNPLTFVPSYETLAFERPEEERPSVLQPPPG